MDDNVIKVENLSKKFALNLKRGLAYGTVDLAKSFVGIKPNRENLRKGEFWALKDISFELKRGETLGIIGPNGSGKSTLLRMLTGIFPPDTGKMTVRGRVGALIAVGAGFHPHMTGRENIYLNGTILGMTRKEINEKYDDIVSFAEIGKFIDAPVSAYSSGMKVRLGFSIAIHSDTEILLVDEILSVGDLAFRNKSLRKMYELRNSSKGIIFISHNVEQVMNICDRVIVMKEGQILFDGNVNEGVVKYYEVMNDMKQGSLDMQMAKAMTKGKYLVTDDIEILDGGILDENGNKIEEIDFKQNISAFFDFKLNVKVEEPKFSVVIRNDLGKDAVWVQNNDADLFFGETEPGKYRLRVDFKEPNLVPNVYDLGFTLANHDSQEIIAQVQGFTAFKVRGFGKVPRGTLYLDHEWHLDKE